MGLGVPVVTSFWGTDARELAAAGAVLGHEPRDVDGLCHQIETVLEKEHLRRDLAKKARACAALYDARTAAAESDGLFAELATIGARRAGETGD